MRVLADTACARTCMRRYRSQSLSWHFRPHSVTLFSATIAPEAGLLVVRAQQLHRALVLRVQAGLDSFSRVGGPTRGGFVPHSVESYSATATVGECVAPGVWGGGVSGCCSGMHGKV